MRYLINTALTCRLSQKWRRHGYCHLKRGEIMPDIINSVKEEFINEYIRKIDTAIETYNATIGSNDEIFDLVIEISNVFENDIPNLQTSVLIRTGTEIRDANIVRAMLIKYLADKAYEGRIGREIEKKEGLLNDIEEVTDLKLMPLKYHKERLLFGRDYSFKYKDSDNNVFDGLSFEINNGDRVVIDGENGSGKSSLIKAILDMNRGIVKENANYEGEGILEVPENLVISYINQDTSHLKGFLKDYCELQGLDYTLFLSLLRQLDFERVQFVKPMEQYSEGQKKKVLIAASLLTSAHLYIWDEPLNYIDVFTRMQIEKLIETYRPTMLLVEHDVTFKEKIANKVIRL